MRENVVRFVVVIIVVIYVVVVIHLITNDTVQVPAYAHRLSN